MAFPATPLTLIGRLKKRDMPRIWEASWEQFFDLYHLAARTCVAGIFHSYRWHAVKDEVVEEITMKVFVSIFQQGESWAFDPTRGKFRTFLSTLCRRRVIDFLREHRDDFREVSGDGAMEAREVVPEESHDPFNEREDAAFHHALLGTLLSALRAEVSPQVYLIFELVKLLGEDPAVVAKQLKVRRGVVDNAVYKAMKKLKELAQQPEIQGEFKQ